jgi:hypothetical protein
MPLSVGGLSGNSTRPPFLTQRPAFSRIRGGTVRSRTSGSAEADAGHVPVTREPASPVSRHSAMTRFLLAGLSLVLLSACGHTSTGAGGRPQVAAEPTGQTVADYFFPPQPYPGPTWTREGRPVNGRELNSIAGPDHCGWQSAVIMHLGWPLGTVSQTSAEIHQFIRDPNGVIDQGLHDKLALHVVLPPDARDTGYRNGELALWLSPADPDTAYLRTRTDIERWPRADPVVACD